MSIASEITRLQGAKANLKLAIESKGVTVPSSTTLDGYASLVESISGGGGGGGSWEQKQVTVSTSISLGDGFASLINNNTPNGTKVVIIAKDELDTSQYINNQLIFGVYNVGINAALNNFIRYRGSAYQSQGGDASIWSSTYAITASQGDTYTLIYQ